MKLRNGALLTLNGGSELPTRTVAPAQMSDVMCSMAGVKATYPNWDKGASEGCSLLGNDLRVEGPSVRDKISY